jgi:hypothetical protein
VIDCCVAFGTQAAAARHLGISHKSVSSHLERAAQLLEKSGLVFSGEDRNRYTQILALWVMYWWSDEGKSKLRNERLTSPPEA